MKLCIYLNTWLDRYIQTSDPLLLGYSGGVDSQGLFHLLLPLVRKKRINLHLVHVDHAFRETSADEAQLLKNHVESYGVTFHHHRLDPIEKRASIENALREKRYDVFKKVYHELRAQGLILAHHGQDQEETIFKRLFEGASLFKLSGLKEVSNFEGMRILRPLLSFDKKQLTSYVEKNNLFFIDDKTNQDTQYLRNRQRLELFPYIEKAFGKTCIKHLHRLKTKIDLLESYLSQNLNDKKVFSFGPFAVTALIDTLVSFHPLEIEFLLRGLCKQLSMTPSHEQISTLIQLIEKKGYGKKVVIQSFVFVLDKGYLAVTKDKNPDSMCFKGLSLKNLPCTLTSERYVWTLEPILLNESLLSVDHLINGVFDVPILEDVFSVMTSDHLSDQHKKILFSTLSNVKIPAHFIHQMPLTVSKGRVGIPWIKRDKSLKEKQGVRFTCKLKNCPEGDLYSSKSIPLVFSKS